MKTIRINRKKWACDPAKWQSELFNTAENRGCCLGHVIHQIKKCAWSDLANLGCPDEYYKGDTLLTTKINCIAYSRARDNQLSSAAININDDSRLSTKEKEKQLKSLFKKHDINLEFYGNLE